MNRNVRDLAVTESYSTFWDKTPEPPAAPPVAPDDAYSTFVNLAENDLPDPHPGVAD